MPGRASKGVVMAGTIEAIYTAPREGAALEKMARILAVQGCGLQGDRYCEGTGHWSRFGRVCEVTLIEGEDLDGMESEAGIRVKNGEHRHNIVTRGVSLKDLRRGRRLRVGEAVFEYRGPRSVCRYIERLTEPGMTQALKGRAGVCARVVEKGRIGTGDAVVLV